jgi:hypothetical protein
MRWLAEAFSKPRNNIHSKMREVQRKDVRFKTADDADHAAGDQNQVVQTWGDFALCATAEDVFCGSFL